MFTHTLMMSQGQYFFCMYALARDFWGAVGAGGVVVTKCDTLWGNVLDPPRPRATSKYVSRALGPSMYCWLGRVLYIKGAWGAFTCDMASITDNDVKDRFGNVGILQSDFHCFIPMFAAIG
jgi:hypothetical protein